MLADVVLLLSDGIQFLSSMDVDARYRLAQQRRAIRSLNETIRTF